MNWLNLKETHFWQMLTTYALVIILLVWELPVRVLRMAFEARLLLCGGRVRDKDLHSGSYGGSVHELWWFDDIMSKLVDKRVIFLCRELWMRSCPLTPTEQALYESIDFDHNLYREEIGTKRLLFDNKTDIWPIGGDIPPFPYMESKAHFQDGC